jgi:hypothetical protein
MADLPGRHRDSTERSVVPIKPDDPAKSVSGRLLYLNAIGQYCDGFWESLRDRVLFPCAFYELQAGGVPFTLSPFDPAFDRPFPLPVELLSPHDQEVLGRSEPVGRRIYEAAVMRESANAFKRRMRQQFEKQLSQYTTQSKERILEQKHMRRDAAWTALYQGGLSPKEIEAWEHQLSGDDFSHARILQAINKFADSIGLTLRPPKAGRNAKSSRNPASRTAPQL